MGDINIPMSLKERLLHSLLFEIGAVTVASVVVLVLSTVKPSTAIGTGVAMALMAMVWNLVFNAGFDKIFAEPRQNRNFKLRLFHTISFEPGCLFLPFR